MTPFDIPELVYIIVRYIVPEWWTDAHTLMSESDRTRSRRSKAFHEFQYIKLVLSRLICVNRCLASVIRPILWNYVYIPAKLENLVLNLFELVMYSSNTPSGIGDPFNTLVACLDIPEPYCLWYRSYLPCLRRIFVSLEESYLSKFTKHDYFSRLNKFNFLYCVEEFSLVSKNKPEYEAIVSQLKFIPKLKILRMSSGATLDMSRSLYVYIDEVVRDIECLECLHISNYRIAFRNVECPNTKLRRLAVQHFNIHDAKVIKGLANFTKRVGVSDLYVDVPHFELTNLHMQFPNVKKLKLDDCTEFKAIFDAFPNIEELCLNCVIFPSDYQFVCKLIEGILTSTRQFKKLVILGSKGRLISKSWCAGPLYEATMKYPELQGRNVTIYFPENEKVVLNFE